MRRGWLLAVACAVASCGTTLASLPLKDGQPRDALVTLEAGQDVRFWAEFDATYDGHEIDAWYVVQLLQGGAVVDATRCEPLRLGHASRVCTVHIEVGDTHTIHCRMPCTARVPVTGPTVVRARLFVHGRAARFRLDRADLIVKQ